ncbi:Fur family transcriptional regulator [Hugonella massiliensis]|uniref:Fur family transcriptional regulator n=1 Tax=Hugonella massiliensis TaxID=1720315 RepID=UPI00073E15F3|nr:transcriptional repressor [Hugonella massiliensis]
MKAGSGYKTRQRSAVVAVLEGADGAHMTAKQVHEELVRRGSSIGAATVYRQLERMVDEGMARRYNLGPGEAACYEYTAGDPCAREHCFHCVCTVCGKLYHVECDYLGDIAEHLSQEHGFAVDPQRTVFYGVCKECQAKREG